MPESQHHRRLMCIPYLGCHTLNQVVLQSGAHREYVLQTKKRKEESAPVSVMLMRSHVLYQAAQGMIPTECLKVVAEQKAQQA